MNRSYWEDFLCHDDVLIIGGGLVGLLTAIELRERSEHTRVRVIERGLLPAGATTRNAGFACFGSLTEILSDASRMGVTAAVELVAKRWEGLARLRSRLGDSSIGYELHGGAELLFGDAREAIEAIPTVNQWLRGVIADSVFREERDGIARRGFRSATALVCNPYEGQVHSAKLYRALWFAAVKAGVEVMTGAEATTLEEGSDGVRVVVRGALGELTLRAPRVVLCTNAFSDGLCSAQIAPARGQVIVTEPIEGGLSWRGCYHFDEGFYYFREVDGRVLFGGGRNIDVKGEETTEMNLTEEIQSVLERHLRETIVPGRDVVISHRWAGVMGFRSDKKPAVETLSARVTLAFGCNGMGVAMGATIAEEAAVRVLQG